MFIDIIKSVLLGGVEGITEFLPISSTGHLILINQWIKFSDVFTKNFDIIIQLGAICAVIVFFWSKLWPFGKDQTDKVQIFDLWKKSIIGVVPAIIFGALLASFIEKKLFNSWVVAFALIIGGIIFLYIEKRVSRGSIVTNIDSVQKITWKTAFYIGIVQCISMIPGTSRSASTIIGAMLLGVSRSVAVEFSFFLAIPTMIAATGYSVMKHGLSMSGYEFILLAVGFLSAFAVAYSVIKLFMNYIQTHNFVPFAYYRIILGVLVIVYFLSVK